jgi:hypothetical protein
VIDDLVELVDQPLCARRQRLEVLLGPRRPCRQLVAQTVSVDEAEQWLALVRGMAAQRML